MQELLASYKKEISVEADQVRAAGGLFIIGTERHESRRIDNQLRGRSGRQGDPGESRFYLSLEDDVMRLFGSERIMGMMETLGIDEDTPIDQKILSNAVESAQRNVEGRNFRARKNVLEYDDVMNTQREVIYAQRRKVLDGGEPAETMCCPCSARMVDGPGDHGNGRNRRPPYPRADDGPADPLRKTSISPRAPARVRTGPSCPGRT